MRRRKAPSGPLVLAASLALLICAASLALALESGTDGTANRCKAGWVETVDPTQHFSVCHPEDVQNNGVNDAIVLHPPDPRADDAFSLSLQWGEKTGFEVIGEPSEEACPNYTVEGQVNSQVLQMSAGGRELAACLNEGRLEGSGTPIGGLRAALPLASDGSADEGYVRIDVGFFAEDVSRVPEEVQAILDTLEAI